MPRTTYKSNSDFMNRRAGNALALEGRQLSSLIDEHIELRGREQDNFWRDGQILADLWMNGTFVSLMTNKAGKNAPAPFDNTWQGFEDFLNHHGSDLSWSEARQRIEVFAAYYNRDDKTIDALLALGPAKAHKTCAYVQETMSDAEVLRIIEAAKAVRRGVVDETLRGLTNRPAPEPRQPRREVARKLDREPAVSQAASPPQGLQAPIVIDSSTEELLSMLEQHLEKDRASLIRFLARDAYKRFIGV